MNRSFPPGRNHASIIGSDRGYITGKPVPGLSERKIPQTSQRLPFRYRFRRHLAGIFITLRRYGVRGDHGHVSPKGTSRAFGTTSTGRAFSVKLIFRRVYRSEAPERRFSGRWPISVLRSHERSRGTSSPHAKYHLGKRFAFTEHCLGQVANVRHAESSARKDKTRPGGLQHLMKGVLIRYGPDQTQGQSSYLDVRYLGFAQRYRRDENIHRFTRGQGQRATGSSAV